MAPGAKKRAASDSKDQSKKPGRKPSGKSRSDIVKDAVNRHRQHEKEAGKKDLRAFIMPATKDWLNSLKQVFGVDSLGEVLDKLAEQANKK